MKILNEYKKRFLASILLISILLFSGLAIAEENEEITKQDAIEAIENMEQVRGEMIEMEFNVQRVNDTINTAKDIFTAQKVREDEGQSPDYSQVTRYEEEINNIKEYAIEARDELFSLEEESEVVEQQGINISTALEEIKTIENEIRDERYERAIDLAPSAFKTLSDLEAEHAAAAVFYRATRGVLKGFWEDNWQTIILTIITIIILYILFRKRIKKYFVQKKLHELELRRSTLKKLTQKTQKGYFEKGTISEEIYNIRTSKFSELVRDIDRQTPMLREEIARLEGKKSKDEKGKKKDKTMKEKLKEKKQKKKQDNKRSKKERKRTKKERRKAERKANKETRKAKRKQRKHSRKNLFDKLSKEFKKK